MTKDDTRDSAASLGSACLARCEFEDWASSPLKCFSLRVGDDGEYDDVSTRIAWTAWWAAWHAQDQKIGLLATELGELSGAERLNHIGGSSVADAMRPMASR